MKNNPKNAFTLIELLVVISIIALLVAILMPALNKAREHAQKTVCLGNQKSLILAWTMYNDDNSGRLPNNYVQQSTMKGNGNGAWVEPPQLPDNATGPDFSMPSATRFKGRVGDLSDPAIGNPEEVRKNGIRAGTMYQYLKNAEIFHCPADNRFAKGTRHRQDADGQIFRTYSLPVALGSKPHTWDGYWIENSERIDFPSGKYVFVEESYDVFFDNGINFSDTWVFDYRQRNPDEYYFWNTLSIFHLNSTTFSFADGHADVYKWQDDTTLTHFNDRPGGSNTIPAPNNKDAEWLVRHHPAN